MIRAIRDVTVGFCALTAACGGEDDPDVGRVTQAVFVGHGGASGVFENGRLALETAVAAGFEATRLAGAVTPVLTGRLTQNAVGGPFAYAPSEDGKLHVDFFDAGQRRQASFTFTEMVAADMSSPSALLNSNHLLEIRVEADGGAFDYVGRSERIGATLDATVKGLYTYEGVRYTLDLRYRDVSLISEIDLSGAHFKSTTRSEGTISGPSVELTVDEDSAFELVSTRGSGESTTASTTESTINSSVRVDGDELRWENVRIRRNFRDGTVSEADTFWQADGRVLRNGQDYGRYALRANVIDRSTGRGFLYVDLVLPGERVQLEQWQQLQ